MKINSFASISKFLFIGILGLASFASCNKDESIGPAPTVTAGSAVTGLAGSTVKIAVSINAPNGIKSLSILKSGANYDFKTYNEGVKSDEFSKDYLIENLSPGSAINFTYIVTDYSNLTTTAGPQVVTVSAIPVKSIVDISGTLEGSISWTKDKIYRLKGFVNIGEDKTLAGPATKTGTLTIQAGTIIIGERSSKGTLIVHRGSKIIAEGTESLPIIFTSERNIGEREPGDWGGLVICGRATNNLPGGNGELEGQYGGFHGGNDDADNSGILKYVRIEYAGIPINPNQEVNSLTLGSVGNGTKIEYVQASYGLDDSFEWFGGTVNAKYLIAYRGLDDDFDVDNGHRGYIQFAVGIRGASQADQSGSNGFEVDNDGSGSNASPFTSSIFSNVSIIGPKSTNSTSVSPQFQNGMHLRRNAKIKIYNTFITAYPNGLFVDGSNTSANANTGDLGLKNIVIAGVSSWGTGGFGEGTTVNPRGFGVRDINTATPAADLKIDTLKPSVWFTKVAGNKILNSNTNTGISASIFSTKPDFTFTTGLSDGLDKNAPAIAGLPSFFEATDYIGAFKNKNWTLVWAEFNPAVQDYSK